MSISGTSNRISGYCYDAAGNLTGQTNCSSPTYVYDAENRLISTAGVTYTYDGDGKRVSKSTSGSAYKLYWTGTGSDPLEETDGSGNTTNEYIFFGGKRIARRNSSGNVFYYFADHLGTSRMIVQAGQTSACYDADFYPYGGERTPIMNTCSQNYKFAGKERDGESGLDNFGARYNSSWMGRFMTPDWSETPQTVPYADFADPQTLNLYAYGRNNPLSWIDRDGHDWRDRLKMAGSAGLNFVSATIKYTGAVALTGASPGTFGLSGAAGIYLAYSGSGNLTAGFLQLTSAVTGNMEIGRAAEVATTVTTATGMGTLLATGGDMDKAAEYAGYEQMLTGAVDLSKGSSLERTFKTIDYGNTVKDTLDRASENQEQKREDEQRKKCQEDREQVGCE